ncbi:TRAP transporter large permease [Paracoccus sp. 1_MG-2023]|uniref:TRAP transporter large permease n=1 Tax=unclassified Paracoccus (in: a-proteobacteria) TaxID=2688777 RepID=UPI001C0850D5|nr:MULTISPECIES: TRAP transporter large permease [unclassified Paracoccus (in: a-proteobacteria)]MBU2958287.1 TRAP transporter large permease [Paracoccus sp. C2R09]MDO6668414.1 TRAP transporter large permease [Paracoccus sp. 1_MG-2023]
MIEPLIVLVVLLSLIAIGAPIFLALGAAGMMGLYMARGAMALFFGPTSLFAQLNSFELLALPLFVLMGNFLSATPVGANLYRAAALWFNRLRGGLAIATVGASTVFGAVSGVSIAGVAAIGSIAVPQMLARGYSHRLAAGSVVSSGALAMLIPPSVPLIIYGAVSGVSVADLFIGGVVPGVMLATVLAGYIWIRATLNPSEAPPEKGPTDWGARIRSLGGLWHAAVLVGLVLGVIYTGVATPSEAGAFGALGALALAALVFRSLTWARFWQILASSARISGAILLIMGCARIFGDYLNLIRLPDTVSQALTQTQLPAFAILMLVMIALLFLGMLVDAVSLIVVTTPILLPLIGALGYDPLWFGIILVMNLEMAVITPPVGLNLYTLKAVAPVLAIEDIIRSVLPFVILQFLVLTMFVLVPELALWLPGLMP